MFDTFLITTSTEGLKPLGTPHQRSFELVSSVVRSRLSDRHAALFAEPVATEFGDRIDWYAAEVEGRARPVSELEEDARTALLADIDALKSAILTEAETLGQSKSSDDQRLSEALINALEYPGQDHVFAVEMGEGQPLQPVLVNWAWTSDRQEAVRGVLSGTDLRAEAEAKRKAEEAALAAAAPVTAPPGRTSGRGAGLGRFGVFLLWLGWLLLALMLAAILWLLIPVCALNMPYLPRNCPPPEPDRIAAFSATAVLQDEIAQLEHSISVADRACQPLPPPPPPPPPPPEPEPEPEPPAQIPNPFQNMPVAPEPQQESEIDKRLNQAGAQKGDLAFSLAWNGLSDLDLYITCPNGQTINYRQKAACNGRLDIDANASNRTRTPVENVFFNGPRAGTYKVRVHLYASRNRGRPEPFQVQIRDQGRVKTLNGMVQPNRTTWTTNYTTGGN